LAPAPIKISTSVLICLGIETDLFILPKPNYHDQGIAGSIAKTLVAPIDRAKILFQVHNKNYEGVGVFECFYQIVKKEGFLALYKGNGAQVLRIFPYAAIQFTTFETIKRFNKSQRFVGNLLAGSIAGLSAVTVTYPLDVIRSRLAFQFKGEEKYTGIIDCLRKTYQENSSPKSFYRGYSVTLLGMIPYLITIPN
jgi:solute carrier family 25 protein 16